MPFYACVNTNNLVTNVIVADDLSLFQNPDFLEDSEPGIRWIETWIDGGPRKTYARIGATYDPIHDIFIDRKPFPSWVLNPDTYQWDPPVLQPQDGRRYRWSELSLQWIAIDDGQGL